jgi:hypothetical protein
MTARQHRVFVEGAAEAHYRPDRVIEHEWGLLLVWDDGPEVYRVALPWHRVRAWVDTPVSSEERGPL